MKDSKEKCIFKFFDRKLLNHESDFKGIEASFPAENLFVSQIYILFERKGLIGALFPVDCHPFRLSQPK